VQNQDHVTCRCKNRSMFMVHPFFREAFLRGVNVVLLMLLTTSMMSATNSTWASPTGTPIRISSPFDLPGGPFQAGHRGIDIEVTAGDPVFSPTFGTVTFVGTVVDRPVLSLRTDEQTVMSIEPVASSLLVGDQVYRGQLLGTVTAGGHCVQSCLHLGVRVNNEYVNPLRFFFRAPVLLPW
jgi:hypothetical protein